MQLDSFSPNLPDVNLAGTQAGDLDTDGLYRFFPSDGVVRSDFCEHCSSLTIQKLLGPLDRTGRYEGYVIPKTFQDICEDASTCQFCHTIAFSIKLSKTRIESHPLPRAESHFRLIPVEQPGCHERPLPGGPFDGFKVVDPDATQLELGNEYIKLKPRRPDERHVSADDPASGSDGSTSESDERIDQIFQDLTISQFATHFGYGYLKCSIALGVTDDSISENTDIPVKFQYLSNCTKDLEVLKATIESCEIGHDASWRKHHQRLSLNNIHGPGPKRLLRISYSKDEYHVSLEEASTGGHCYVALSHCWGARPITKTTSDNLDLFKKQIPFALLPLTFRHAIHLTWQLGIQYLWIDSLCLVQDDIREWESESPRMKEIYAGAFFTIAAAASDSAAGGCFPAISAPADCAKIPFNGMTKEVHARLQPYPTHIGLWQVDELPLFKRGWTLQEQLLSRRILLCGEYEYVLFCPEAITCLSNTKMNSHVVDPNDLKESFLPKSAIPAPKALEAWYYHITKYSNRVLTFPEDKLFAVQGLAHALKPSIPGRYSYGTWEASLRLGLTWRYATPWHTSFDTGYNGGLGVRAFGFSPGEILMQRPRRDRAPSWSWASVDGCLQIGTLEPGYLEGIEDVAGIFNIDEAAALSAQAVSGENNDCERSVKYNHVSDIHGNTDDVIETNSKSSGASSDERKVLEHDATDVNDDDDTSVGTSHQDRYPFPWQVQASFENPTNGLEEQVTGDFAYKLVSLKGPLVEVAFTQNDHSTSNPISNVPGIVCIMAAGGFQISKRWSELIFDDPGFPKNEPKDARYHAVKFHQNLLLLVAETGTAGQHRRIGVINHMHDLLSGLNSDDEELESTEAAYQELFEQVDALATERSILLC